MKLLLSLLLVGGASGFTSNPLPTPASYFMDRKSTSAIKMSDSFDGILSKIKVPEIKVPNFPFLGGDKLGGVTPTPPTALPPIEFKPTPEALYSRARAVLASDMASKDESLLDDKFRWIGPNVAATGALGKEEYLAAARFFDLRSAFPDLEYRAHDFRIDDNDPLTVRFTARTVGTMRGELRLRTETVPPNGKRMRCPPEAISMTFDENTGKLTKMCSGFTMDRLVGNTAGLCGVMAAATVAGAPPSEWEIYPPLSVVNRFFGRTVKQLEEPSSFLAPFPESVMIQLAKGVIASNLGVSDPDLLGPSFTFCGPIVGPIGKDDFLKQFASFDLKAAFPDLKQQYENFRVDPYDPYRVWVDAKGSGTWTGPLNGKEPNGARYEGPLEAVSFTFDDEGFCTRLTAGAVIDPTMGNTGGLGGVYGIFYAVGAPLPSAVTRALPQILSRLQKAALKPITKVDVDDYNLEVTLPSSDDDNEVAIDSAPVTPMSPPPTAPKPVAAVSTPKVQKPKTAAPAKAPLVPPTVPKPPKIQVSLPKPKPPAPPKKPVKPKSQAKMKKSTAEVPIKAEPADPVSDAFASFFGTKADDTPKASPKPVTSKKSTTDKAKAVNEKQIKAADALKAKAEARRKEVEERKAQAEEKRKEAEEKKAAAQKKVAEERKAAEQVAATSARRKEADGRKAAAENNKKEAEKKKAAAAAAAEAKQKAAEERKAAAEAKRKAADDRKAAAEAKRKAAEEKRLAAIEAKQKAAEEKKIAAEAVAEAKRKAAEEKKTAAEAAAEAKRKEIEQKSAASAKQAQKVVERAKPGQTISLFGFGAPQRAGDKSPKVSTAKQVRPSAAPRQVSVAPRGVPTISKWRQNRDGSIAGFISGSPSFQDGEAITTSPITSDATGGAVVQTKSGSRYYLDKQSKAQAKSAAGLFGLFGGGAAPSAEPATSAEKVAEDRKAAAESKRRAAEEKKAAAAAAAEAKRKAAAKQAEERRRVTEKKKVAAVNAKKADQAMKSAKPGATIAISFSGFGKPQPEKVEKSKKPAGPTSIKEQPIARPSAPKGVPTIRRWRQNKDGSIVGSITGSPNFKEGEVITTSPITGDAIGGTVVETSSRSRYFLEEQTKEQVNALEGFFGLFGGGPAKK